jgi:hypothetical protein
MHGGQSLFLSYTLKWRAVFLAVHEFSSLCIALGPSVSLRVVDLRSTLYRAISVAVARWWIRSHIDFSSLQRYPVVTPQVSHFRHVPLRTSVKFPHFVQTSPSNFFDFLAVFTTLGSRSSAKTRGTPQDAINWSTSPNARTIWSGSKKYPAKVLACHSAECSDRSKMIFREGSFENGFAS